ncbi:MAG: HlyD family efflux transporter periplasmic adaptor subunit [Minicystis sp.]
MTRAASPYRTPALLGEDQALRLVAEGRAARVLALVSAALFAAVALALALVPWQQNAPGKGRVIAYSPVERPQAIEAPVEGRIVRWFVEEGARVNEGDPVVDISDNDSEIMSRLDRERAALEERVEAARARLGAVDDRIGALRSSQQAAIDAASGRVRMGQDRARAAAQAVDAAEAAQRAAELNHERQLPLFEKGLASKRTLELAELDVARARTELERARAALSAARAEVSALLADQSKVTQDTAAAVNDATAARATAQAEIAAAQAEIARLEVRVARQRTQAVKAPRAGTVLRLVARQGGEMVKAGDTLALFVPDTSARAVELWVEGNDINLVRKDQRVRLQFEGWPAVQFAGWPSAAVGTWGARVAFADAADDGHGRFRVVVVPEDPAAWPSPEHLRQGTRVNGWILLGRVRLGYELWRQFNGFPPDWTAPDHESKAHEPRGVKGSGDGKKGGGK